MKKAILLSMIASVLVFNQGCTSDEVAAGAIGVAVGVGLGSMDNDDYYHHHHRPDRYDDRWERERWEREHRGGGYPRPYGPYSVDQTIALDSAPNGLDPQAFSFAEKYQIPMKAANKIKQAFADSQKDGMKAFEKIGLDQNGLVSILHRSLPEQKTVQALAQNLGLSESQSQGLLQGMINEFSAQASDIQSPYWQRCMDKGQWKTPENGFCQSTSWTGCSPETGASLCY